MVYISIGSRLFEPVVHAPIITFMTLTTPSPIHNRPKFVTIPLILLLLAEFCIDVKKKCDISTEEKKRKYFYAYCFGFLLNDKESVYIFYADVLY